MPAVKPLFPLPLLAEAIKEGLGDANKCLKLEEKFFSRLGHCFV